MIYILSPSNTTSGGPEAVHQFAYYLKESNIDCKVAYFGKHSKNPTPKQYLKYNIEYVWLKNLKDITENHIIIPEADIDFSLCFKKSKKSMWWLSVDNFYNTRTKLGFKDSFMKLLSGIKNLDLIKIKLLFLDKTHDLNSFENHFFASYYAESFLKEKKLKNIKKLIEPIGLDFLKIIKNKEISLTRKRSNEILYNPTKDKVVVNRLMELYPDLSFMPIKGMTHKQIAERLSKTKVYIDFGHFPGAERIPKEAAIMGCCVITGRKGASNFYGDVCIPDEFKFLEPYNYEEIFKKITLCLNSYETQIVKQKEYKETILDLESNFNKQIKTYFS